MAAQPGGEASASPHHHGPAVAGAGTSLFFVVPLDRDRRVQLRLQAAGHRGQLDRPRPAVLRQLHRHVQRHLQSHVRRHDPGRGDRDAAVPAGWFPPRLLPGDPDQREVAGGAARPGDRAVLDELPAPDLRLADPAVRQRVRLRTSCRTSVCWASRCGCSTPGGPSSSASSTTTCR